MSNVVKFKRLLKDAIPFKYSRDNDACMDVYAAEDATLWRAETKKVQTGIAVHIPEGFEGIVRGRSGNAIKGVHVHIGTIDEEYRGDVSVIITNFSAVPLHIKKGERIAQFTIKKVNRIEFVEDELSDTERGSNGFGSSGTE